MVEAKGETHKKLVEQAKAHLTNSAEMTRVVEASNTLIEIVNSSLNALADKKMLNMGDSLMARALVAHGVMATAAHWWADTQPMLPLPVTTAVIHDLAMNIPVTLDPISYRMDDEG